MKIRKIQFSPFSKTRPPQPTHFSLIDIGTDTIKTAVVRADDTGVTVLGHSLGNSDGKRPDGGRAHSAALASAINATLLEAENATEESLGHKIVPDHAIFLLSPHALANDTFTVTQYRKPLNHPITQKELDALWQSATAKATNDLQNLPNVSADWLPQTLNQAELRLDGHFVNDPIGLSGKKLSLSVVGFSSHPALIRGIERIAEKLELEIFGLIPSPQAIAQILPEKDALVFDVGAGGTTCLRVQKGALTGARHNFFGGNFFTGSLDRRFNATLADAEALKIAFGTDALSTGDVNLVRQALIEPLQRWAEETVSDIYPLFQGHPAPQLPATVYFAGGSAGLPGLKNMLLYTLENSTCTFIRSPEIINLGENGFNGYHNSPDGFRGRLFAPVLGAAKYL